MTMAESGRESESRAVGRFRERLMLPGVDTVLFELFFSGQLGDRAPAAEPSWSTRPAAAPPIGGWSPRWIFRRRSRSPSVVASAVVTRTMPKMTSESVTVLPCPALRVANAFDLTSTADFSQPRCDGMAGPRRLTVG